MINKKAYTISIKILLSENVDKNITLLRNIFHELLIKSFFIDISNFKIVDVLNCTTNSTNYFEIHESFLNENYYLFSDEYLVLPLFISINNYHISFEHTQPQQLIMFKESRILVKKFKDRILNEIIKK